MTGKVRLACQEEWMATCRALLALNADALAAYTCRVAAGRVSTEQQYLMKSLSMNNARPMQRDWSVGVVVVRRRLCQMRCVCLCRVVSTTGRRFISYARGLLSGVSQGGETPKQRWYWPRTGASEVQH